MEKRPTNVRVLLSGPVSPSEDQSKVLAAAKNVLGDCQFRVELKPDNVEITSDSVKCLQKLHDQLRDRRVRDAARRLLIRAREGNKFSLMLNRQAAFSGTLSLCGNAEESPLGPLYLAMESDQSDLLLDWLTAYHDSE